jgi:hypothetical protein
VAEIWQTLDRLGRNVVFTPESETHILSRHSEMADRLNDIRGAIERPDLVARDAQYRHRENHYLHTSFQPPWMKVVVHYHPVPPQGTWAGEVITAYPVKQPDPHEELLSP